MNKDAIPARVGKYRIDQVIGRGAIGIVYKGYDEQIDRPLAIKTLRPEIFNDVSDPEGFLRHFTTEARAAARCLHPNIVTVFDLVEQERRPYIVMEYVDAGTLENLIRAGVLIPIKQIGEIMVQVLLALDHAHCKGVLHRDVKPANILCPSATSIKIADFGVARLDSLDLTKPNFFGAAGTPNYMAPERFLGRAADVRTDLFAAGVILYQLLTGSKPFVACDLPELMRKLLHDAPPSVMTLRPELWCEMDAVAQKALARNPEDRFQTARRFAEALNTAIEARPDDDRLPLDLTSISRSERSLIMADQLSAGAIDALSHTLARWLGPIARLVVKQALKETTDANTLLTSLSRQIKPAAEIALFRHDAEKLLGESYGLASARAQETISDAEIKSAIDVLISVIGPVASRLVHREARTAVGRDDFYRRLGEHIPEGSTKTRFFALRDRPAGGKAH